MVRWSPRPVSTPLARISLQSASLGGFHVGLISGSLRLPSIHSFLPNLALSFRTPFQQTLILLTVNHSMGATVAHHGGRRRWRSNNRPAAAMIIAALTTLLFVASIATFIARLPTTSAAAAEQQQRPPPRFPLGPSAPNIRSSLLEEVLTPPASLGDDICRPTGQIEDACCDYETVEKSLNTPKFFATLENLVKTNYFRFYKVDLYRDCPFWVENGLCMNRVSNRRRQRSQTV